MILVALSGGAFAIAPVVDAARVPPVWHQLDSQPDEGTSCVKEDSLKEKNALLTRAQKSVR